jgi:integrase
VTMYAVAHWIPFFRSASRFTSPMIDAYRRMRLGKVTRSTTRKELSGLRLFAEWWAEHGGPRVEVASLPKQGLPGKRAKNARKPKALVLMPAQVERVLRELPVRNKLGAPVRDLFRVLWETGLRESTVFALEVPTHFKPRARELLITREIDKTAESGERRLDITAACSKALTRIAPESGRIFTRLHLRDPLKSACVAAGLPVVSPYDLRHSRFSAWANAGGPLAGVQYLAGHASISTTARYIQPGRDAARAVLGVTSGGSRRLKRGRKKGHNRKAA